MLNLSNLILNKKILLFGLYFWFVFLSGTSLYAQSDSQININSQTKHSKLDTNYIEDKSNYLNLFTHGLTKYYKFSITNKGTNQSLLFSPNDIFNVGFGFNYKWLGFSFAFNIPALNNDDEKFGKTQRFDAQMNIFAHKFLIDIFFNYYQGFYITNPESYDSTFTRDMNYPIVPSLQTSSLGFAYFHVINNRKFSYRASFVQNEIQKKMSGSFILGYITNITSTSSDSTFVPQEYTDNFDKEDDYQIKSIVALDVGPLFGYAYNFVIAKKFMITLSLIPGIVSQIMTINTIKDGEAHQFSYTKLGFVMSNKIAILYNGQRFYAGFNYNDNHSFHSFDQYRTATQIGNFRFFVGRRFGSPKK
ncbi:MAG: DUF4421 family protein [Bacteroidales bacterium]|nr:DUF4421 family protein [Bacteroidales bacterium]